MPNRGQQGTGKHGHKDTQEPYPHHEAKSSGGDKDAKHKASEQKTSGKSGSAKDSDDLKSREYKDAQGIHHHTRTSGKN